MGTTPVLLLIFNRPDTTGQVVDAIRQAEPDRLYVAADGPRTDDEAIRCEQARQIATDVDCEVHTLFRERNLGCRRAVSEAIDWFFEHEPEGVILEDDCLPDPSFFPFCAELLDRYRDDPRVMCISGNFRAPIPTEHSYTFSKYPHIWGWATWRHAWERYDRNLDAWPDLRGTRWLASKADNRHGFVRAWRARFDAVREGQIDSWAYAWVFTCFLHGGLAAVAGTNLVTNLGFGDDATHTIAAKTQLDTRPVTFPLRHPKVAQDRVLDRWEDRNVHGARASWRGALPRVPGLRSAVRRVKSLVRA